ncbi:MAG: SurA N-terminal domain-containing protein [Gammaproteobacteria bacterium]|nr:SurA N-terminal domain-containing protein [Gammaproteobacteria bacterium]
MLGYIRESVQGWIAWAIVILLIIPFALWGINEYFGTGGKLVVANVNGEEITQQAYQREFYLQRDRLREMFGEQFNPSLMDAQIKQKALDDIINREVIVQAADAAGYRISDGFLVQTIQGFEAFQENGAFSSKLYKQQLSAQGESPDTFEYRIQRAVLSQQMYSGVAATPVVTKYDVDYLLKLQEQTRDISYMVLKADALKQDADATEEAIKQYYDQNSVRYMTPEMVSLQYLELNVKDLATDQQPTEEELKQFYEERSNLYVTPEERRTRHILITVDAGASEEQIQAAKNKATDLRKQITEGADFEKLAREHSNDPGSAQLGGDIGFFGKDSLDPAYEKAMYSLKVGEVSEPVLSAFGYHIIKLEEIREEKARPFEDVKASLITEYQQGIAERKFFELSEKLTNMAYEVPDTLEDSAGATGLQIKTTDLFPQTGGAGIASNPKVAAAAFSEDLLKQGYNSEPISIGENHVVVIRVKDHQEAKLKPFEEVKDAIKAQLISEKAQQRANQQGLTIIEQLTKGEATPEAAAKIVNVEWKKAGELKRTDRTIDGKIVQQAFKMPRPAQGKTGFSGVALASGDYAIVGLGKVTDGDVAKIEQAKRETLMRNLSGIRGEEAFVNLLQNLKENSSIVVLEDNL